MNIRNELRVIVEENKTKRSRYFDNFIQTLILISLVSFAFETLPDNSESVKSILWYIEIVSVILFSIEYLLRIYVSRKPFNYILSFYGFIDLVAILPFYISKGLDLRFLRVFRVFRIFRSLKLIRYNRAMRRFHLAAKIVREELVLFLIVTAIFIFITASGIYFFENEAQPDKFSSVFSSLWWAVVTLTTVGYGDVYPITTGGRIFTFFILIIGVGIVTVPAGLVASALSKAREIEEKEQ